MDGAREFTVDVAIRKARTAAAIGVSTAILEAAHKERFANSRKFIALRGGSPVLHQGKSIGAVGVSGAPPEVDEIIVSRGLEGMPAA
jgi:glc operon protein GlcG